MASIVSAGTTSATALNMSADTTGVLSLASNNGVVALIIDASQNIGVNSASSTIRTKLMASSSNVNDAYTLGTVSGAFSVTNLNTNYGLQFGSFSTGNSWIQSARMDGTATAYNLILQPGGGDVGIGTSSPVGKVESKTANMTGASAAYAQKAFVANIPYSTSNITSSLVAAYDGTIHGADIGYAYNGSGYNLMFATNSTTSGSPTERMRITSGGDVLVGATSAVVTAKLGIYQTSADAALFINPSNASYNGTVIYTNTTRAASTAFDFIGSYANSVGQFRVTGVGVIYAQNTSVQSISDQRLKENIRDSSDGLSVISGLRPVRYDWKEGHGNNQKNQLGFIAQEIETVFPEAVSEWQVNKDDETVYKTVGPGALIPVLVKAIQEQQALITTLTERITALEGA